MSNLNITCTGFIFMAVCKIYNGVWRGYMCCVCACTRDVIHCYGSMLISVPPCWGEECPGPPVNVSYGEVAVQHVDSHICYFEYVFVFMCEHLLLWFRGNSYRSLYVSGYVCVCVCKELDLVTVACVPILYHGDHKWPFKSCQTGWWDKITSMMEQELTQIQGWVREIAQRKDARGCGEGPWGPIDGEYQKDHQAQPHIHTHTPWSNAHMHKSADHKIW